jgi:hypothetical protein
MANLQFKILINAPVARVYDCMLGLSSKTTYEQWTAVTMEKPLLLFQTTKNNYLKKRR